MSRYAFYSEVGEIASIYRGQSPSIQGTNYISISEDVQADSHYVPNTVTPVITARPVPPIIASKLTYVADGTDFVTISGIPIGSTVDISTTINLVPVPSLIMTDTLLVVRSADIGESTYNINLFPNQEVVIILEATV